MTNLPQCPHCGAEVARILGEVGSILYYNPERRPNVIGVACKQEHEFLIEDDATGAWRVKESSDAKRT